MIHPLKRLEDHDSDAVVFGVLSVDVEGSIRAKGHVGRTPKLSGPDSVGEVVLGTLCTTAEGTNDTSIGRVDGDGREGNIVGPVFGDVDQTFRGNSDRLDTKELAEFVAGAFGEDSALPVWMANEDVLVADSVEGAVFRKVEAESGGVEIAYLFKFEDGFVVGTKLPILGVDVCPQ